MGTKCVCWTICFIIKKKKKAKKNYYSEKICKKKYDAKKTWRIMKKQIGKIKHTQPPITCPNLTIKTLKQGVKYVQS